MMPEWQRELEALLAALDVTMEHRPSLAVPSGGAAVVSDSGPERDTLDDEIAAVRVEVEATLARVLALAREGRIDLTTRDDIILVLRALLQPKTTTHRHATVGDSAYEWEFASVATVLRFCRLVLYLT